MSTDLKFSLVTTFIVLALIVAGGLTGECLLPRTSRHIVIESAKVFCIFVNFSFFVIDVMLLTLS